MLARAIAVAAVGVALLRWSTPNVLAQQQPMPTFEAPGLPAGPTDCVVVPSLSLSAETTTRLKLPPATSAPTARPNTDNIPGGPQKRVFVPRIGVGIPPTSLTNCGPSTASILPQWDPRGHASPDGAIKEQLQLAKLNPDLSLEKIITEYESCYRNLFTYTNQALASGSNVDPNLIATCLRSLASGPSILEPVRRSIGILVWTKPTHATAHCTATQIDPTTIVTALHCLRETGANGFAPLAEFSFRPYRAPKTIANIASKVPPSASSIAQIIEGDPNSANRIGDMVFLRLAQPLDAGFMPPPVAAAQATLDQFPATPLYFVAFNALYAFKGNAKSAAGNQSISALLDGDWTVAMSYPDPHVCMLAKGADATCLAHSCPAFERNSGGPLFQVQAGRVKLVGVHSGNISVDSQKQCGVVNRTPPAFEIKSYRNLATPLAGAR